MRRSAGRCRLSSPESSVKKLLLQLDTSPLPSVFDRVVAHDGGADDVMSYGGVTPETVRDLVHGCIFTRGPKDLHHTAIFVGGTDMAAGERLFAAARKAFFGPMRVSVMLDSNGSNTTAVAAVAKVVAGRRRRREGRARGRDRRHRPRRHARRGPAGQGGRRGDDHVAPRGGRRVPRGAAEAVRRHDSRRHDDRRRAGGAACSTAPRCSSAPGRPACAWCRARRGPGAPGLRVAADLNAVPPQGIEGIDVQDNGAERDGVVVFGALGVGGLKMKIHKACIARLFESNDAGARRRNDRRRRPGAARRRSPDAIFARSPTCCSRASRCAPPRPSARSRPAIDAHDRRVRATSTCRGPRSQRTRPTRGALRCPARAGGGATYRPTPSSTARAFEDDPRAVSAVSRAARLWGNPPDVLRQVRSPRRRCSRGLARPRLSSCRACSSPAADACRRRERRVAGEAVSIRRRTRRPPVDSAVRRFRPRLRISKNSSTACPARLSSRPGAAARCRSVISRQLAGDRRVRRRRGSRYCGSILSHPARALRARRVDGGHGARAGAAVTRGLRARGPQRHGLRGAAAGWRIRWR